MKPKIRIKLLNPDGCIINDRLVDQFEEFTRGPKEEHTGPITLEFTLIDSESVDQCKKYIDQLRGNLPIIKTISPTKTQLDVNAYKEIFIDLKKQKSVEKVIEYLDKLDFTFVTFQHLRELVSDGKYPYNIKNLVPKSQYMIRCSRIAVDPKNDKFDYTMIIGISLFKRRSGVKIYRKGSKISTLQLKWDKPDGFNMKEKKIPQKYPQYMTIEERKKYRGLERKVEKDRELGKSDQKFFDRFKPEIDKING